MDSLISSNVQHAKWSPDGTKLVFRGAQGIALVDVGNEFQDKCTRET